jgi:hypothetical protein
MTQEEFARVHHLPPRWLWLRRECESLIRNPEFWYKRELQEAARTLATEASDILYQSLRR